MMVESKPFSLPFQLGSTLKVKKFAPEEQILFSKEQILFLELDFFFKGYFVQKSKQENRILSPIEKKNGGENMGGVHYTLLGFRPININKTKSVNTPHQQTSYSAIVNFALTPKTS